MELGVVTLSIGFMDFLTVLRFIKEIGGTTMELSTADGVHNNTLDFTPKGRSSIVDAVRSEGLSITSLGGYSDFTISDPDELRKQFENIEWYCQLAVDLKVKIVRVMAGNAKEGLSQSQMVDNIISGFKVAAKIAEKYGVILALENHGTVVNDGPTLLRVAESVGSPNFRVTMDTGNFCWYTDNTVDEAYRYFEQVAPYVANVHLKDLVVGDDNKVKFVPLGEGLLDYRRIIDILDGVGYQGALLCEYEGMGDPRVLIADGIFTRDEFVNELQSGTRRSLVHLRSVMGA